MRRARGFTLARHLGDYEDWPLTSPLLQDGLPTRTRLGGYALRFQFEARGYYLLASDFECPFEERTVFTLLDTNLRVLATRAVGRMYDSYQLTQLEPDGPEALIAHFTNGVALRVSIRPWGIPMLYSRLCLERTCTSA